MTAPPFARTLELERTTWARVMDTAMLRGRAGDAYIDAPTKENARAFRIAYRREADARRDHIRAQRLVERAVKAGEEEDAE